MDAQSKRECRARESRHQRPHVAPLVAIRHRPSRFRKDCGLIAAQRQQQWMALVSEAFGGSGGIQQYNRDLLSAVAVSGAGNNICVLPRHAPKAAVTPAGGTQRPPKGRASYLSARLSLPLAKSFCV